MHYTKVRFKNQNGVELAAHLDRPVSGKPKAYALFAHCFTCNKNFTAIRNISRALNQAGIAVLRFDFAGLGESEGDFADTDFSSNVEDLLSAADHLAEHYEAPKLFIGHSLGGAAVLFAAAKYKAVEAVATIAAPADPGHVQNLLHSSKKEILEKGEAEASIGGRSFKIKASFLHDLEGHHPEKVISGLRKPLLVAHSPHDTVVGIDNAANIYQWAHHPKSFISLDGADHLLTDKDDSTYTGSVIATWANRYLPAPEEQELSTDKDVVVELGPDGYTTDIMAGPHSLTADEPASMGGADLGPNPYGLVTSALGACTAMTLHMYARRKKWPLEDVRVHLSHDKEHMEDCEDCEKSSSKVDVFQREVEITGNLSDDQRQRLLEIANKCPVHRTLSSASKIETRWRDNEE